MLIDLVAAKAEEAHAVLSTPGHANVCPTLEAKTVDQVKLASLAFILRAKPLDDGPVIEYMGTFKNLESASDDGPWIYLLPDDLVADLAGLRDEEVEKVAKEWSATEEAILDRWDPKDVASFLREFSAFAALATAQERRILLWASL